MCEYLFVTDSVSCDYQRIVVDRYGGDMVNGLWVLTRRAILARRFNETNQAQQKQKNNSLEAV